MKRSGASDAEQSADQWAERREAQRSSVERSEASGVERGEVRVKIKTPRSFRLVGGIGMFLVLVEANYGGETACLVILSIRVKNRTLS